MKNAPKSANSYFKKSIKWHLSVPRNNLSRNVFIKPHDSVLNVHNQVMCFWPYTRHTRCDVSSLNPRSFQFCQDVVYGGRGNISRTKCPQWLYVHIRWVLFVSVRFWVFCHLAHTLNTALYILTCNIGLIHLAFQNDDFYGRCVFYCLLWSKLAFEKWDEGSICYKRGPIVPGYIGQYLLQVRFYC